jgi:hypothetical protein
VSARLSGVRVRQSARSGTRKQKAYRGKRRGAAKQSSLAKRETENRRKALRKKHKPYNKKQT